MAAMSLAEREGIANLRARSAQLEDDEASWALRWDARLGVARGIAPLVQQAVRGSAREQALAAKALAQLAEDDANDEAITQAGGVPPLVRMLSEGDLDCRTAAAKALGNLANTESNQVSRHISRITRTGGGRGAMKLIRPCLLCFPSLKVAIAYHGGLAPLVALARVPGKCARASATTIGAWCWGRRALAGDENESEPLSLRLPRRAPG